MSNVKVDSSVIGLYKKFTIKKLNRDENLKSFVKDYDNTYSIFDESGKVKTDFLTKKSSRGSCAYAF
jgi:hypothetical protein